MVYDLVVVIISVNGILLAECRKRTISPILNFIIRKNADRFKVRGLFLYIPTYWYSLKVGVYRAVIMMDDRTCK